MGAYRFVVKAASRLLPISPEVTSVRERVFSTLRDDSFRPLVNHFIQLLKKESMRSNTYFSSIPADRNVFINRTAPEPGGRDDPPIRHADAT
jgi:hypothetical protein